MLQLRARIRGGSCRAAAFLPLDVPDLGLPEQDAEGMDKDHKVNECMSVRSSLKLMRGAVLICGLLLVVGTGFAPYGTLPIAMADQPPRDDALENLLAVLALAPEISDSHSETLADGIQFAQYVDYRAAERAAGFTTPITSSALSEMDGPTFDRWATAMSRIALRPLDMSREVGREQVARRLPEIQTTFRALPEFVGFDWFAIDQSLYTAGTTGAAILLRSESGFPSSTQLHAALAKLGFQQSDKLPVPSWSRFEDNETRSESALPTDIVGGHLQDPFDIASGSSARIALFDSGAVMAAAFSWPALAAVVDAHASHRAMAEMPAVRTAAEALNSVDDSDRLLIQALFLSWPYLSSEDVARSTLGQFATRDQIVAMQEILMSRPNLPPYDMVALADTQVDGQEQSSIAVVFRDLATAHHAAPILANNFSSWYSGKGVMLSELLHVTIETRILESPGTGMAVVMIDFKPAAGLGDKNSVEKSGWAFKTMLETFMFTGIDPLFVRNP